MFEFAWGVVLPVVPSTLSKNQPEPSSVAGIFTTTALTNGPHSFCDKDLLCVR